MAKKPVNQSEELNITFSQAVPKKESARKRKQQEEKAKEKAAELEREILDDAPQKEKKPKKEKKEKTPKKPTKKRVKGSIILSILGDIFAKPIYLIDDIMDAISLFFELTFDLIQRYNAWKIDVADYILDGLFWTIDKFNTKVGRKIYDVRLYVKQNVGKVLKHALVGIIMSLLLIGAYVSVIDYQYSYNGKVLGVVKEQDDVIEILDLVSDELSAEYGANIKIDATKDITFKPVISTNQDIDTMDQVLEKFAYMGSLNVVAYGIEVDGDIKCYVENQKVAENVLNRIVGMYVKNRSDYDSIRYQEDVKIVEGATTLINVMSEDKAFEFMYTSGEGQRTYTAVSGDSFYGIASKNGITYQELRQMNPQITNSSKLHVGDKLVIQKSVPLVTIITEETTVITEKIAYTTKYESSSAYYKYMSITKQAGKNGSKDVTAKITKINGEEVSREELKTVVTVEPVTRIIVNGTKPNPKFIYPLYSYGRISARFNQYYRHPTKGWTKHTGTDFTCSYGASVLAIAAGTVTYAGYDSGLGYYIKIDHGNGYLSIYGHNSKLLVKKGDKVKQGQVIAQAGRTGVATGTHVHLELWLNNNRLDALKYLTK